MTHAVRAKNLGKDYEVYDRPADRLLELISFRDRHRRFTALQDVSLEIQPGESVGLIGLNGAGKSTLLKLVSGVARPSRGELEVNGAVASILELGTGFHPEFSGKDNAALNAAILGLSPTEIARALPRIFEFSELGPFLDRPVRTYSSGMYMRLAFSVAVSVDPEVLIVDEALAVGDAHFQKKCVDRIREFQQSGRTLLFCSHAMYFVTSLCRRTLWLDKGRLVADGPSVDVVHAYETRLLEMNRVESRRGDTTLVEDVTFADVEVLDAEGHRAQSIGSGDSLIVRARVNSSRAGRPSRIRVTLIRAADEIQCCAAVMPDNSSLPPGLESKEISVRVEGLPLTRGDYGVVLQAEAVDDGLPLGRCEVLPAFRVRGDRFEVGIMRLGHEWRAEVGDA